MKKNILLFFILFGYISFAQNTVNIASESVSVDTNFSLAIDFENADDIAAFQFDITYTGNAIDLGSGHSLTARASTHVISANNLDENTIRVIAYSTNNTIIPSGTGTVLNLNFESENEPGTYAIEISNIVLSDVNGTSLTSSGNNGQVIVEGSKYVLNTTSIAFGDVPLQGSTNQNITISNTGNTSMDVTSYSLAPPFSISTSFPVTIAAGASASFVVDVDTSVKQNVTKSAVFNTTDASPLRAIQATDISANVYAVNEIHIGAGSGNINTPVTIPVSINNMESFNGFQLDITLPNEINYVTNSIALSGRETDHLLSASMLNSNTLRIIAYSSTNANFTASSGEVFSFDLIPNVSSGNYSLATSGEIISNSDLGNIESDSFAGSITINAPNLTITSADATLNLGRIPITENSEREITLRNSGNADLVIDEVIYNSNALTSNITEPLIINSNESSDKIITFNPATVGAFSSTISIRHNGAAEQNIVEVNADVFSPNYLLIEDASIYRNENNNINLNISNNDAIKAIQFDINIPSGFVFDYENVVKNSNLSQFNVSSSDLGNGNFRFVIYTLSNQTIPANSNNILILPVFVNNSTPFGDYNFTISEIVLSSTSNENVASEALLEGVIKVTNTRIWTGNKDTNWNDTSNWNTSNTIPASADVEIPDGLINYPTMQSETNITLKNININENASLTLAKDAALTLTEGLINNGIVVLESDADEFSSLIINGSSTGNINYERYVNPVSNGWDLVGSPVSNSSISSFQTTNSSVIATNPSDANTYAIGTYDNTTDNWSNYTSSTIGAVGNFTSGKGYQMATTSGAAVTFTGAVPTSDVTIPIQNNDAANSGAGRRWNLIANPYPSYLNGNSVADATNNFLTVNTAVLDDNYEAIYGYNGTDYTIYNHIYNDNTAVYIAPGQGFFVAAASTSAANVRFTEAMQTVSGTDDFIAKTISSSHECIVSASIDNVEQGSTKLYFQEGLHTGLDPGYDAGAFNQQTLISTRLATEDTGVNFAINAMGLSDLEDTIIPVSIYSEKDKELTIQIQANMLPAGTFVYLKDNQLQTIHDLTASSFSIKPNEVLEGTGRFYLHLRSSALSTSDYSQSDLPIIVYKLPSNSTLTIEGLQEATALSIYNLLGAKVHRELLNATLKQSIEVSHLQTGVYIIQINTSSQQITKKLFID